MQQCNLGNICALCIMQALSWAASGDPRLLVNLEQLFADAAGLGLKVGGRGSHFVHAAAAETQGSSCQ